MSRHILIALVLAMLAGCATTARNTYYYDQDGDYYYGANSADVIIDSGPSYSGYAGYGYGYGFGGYGGYSPWFGGGGFGYSPWAYGYGPIWLAPYPSIDHRAARRDRVDRDRVARQALTERPSGGDRSRAAKADRTSASRDALGNQRFAPNRRDALPSADFAPSQRAPMNRSPRDFAVPRPIGAEASRNMAPQQRVPPRSDAGSMRPAPAPRMQSAPQRSAPPAAQRAPSTRRE